jgi:hypothetical protein
MYKEILMKKLIDLGYSESIINEKLDKFDFSLLDQNRLTEEEYSKNIEVIEYTKPNVEIIRSFLNTDNIYVQRIPIEGILTVGTDTSKTGSSMTIVDYKLNQKICLLTLNNDCKIEILIYNPDEATIKKYGEKTYEQIVKDERNLIVEDYLDALEDSGRLTLGRSREILNMLLEDYVIDEMVIMEFNPRLKLYDSHTRYAENITEYQLKYINRRTNRVEMVEKPVFIKRLGKGVKQGFITNDPYAKVGTYNKWADFSLNKISYYWLFNNERQQQEIGVYIGRRESVAGGNNYSDFCMETFNEKIEKMTKEIKRQFSSELEFEADEAFIKNVLKKLNAELVIPSIDVINRYKDESTLNIEYIVYKYRAIKSPEEYENRLYISIEDNIGKRYKYKLPENIDDELTVIGNKLDYTDENGNNVKKQSVADFNVNDMSAIIKRETLIEASESKCLLGYIYDDIECESTNSLPIPTLEVAFYFPNPSQAGSGVRMFNGTNVSQTLVNNNDTYVNINLNIDEEQKQAGGTVVIVRYQTSNGEILKENAITNVVSGKVYSPEIIPVISDKEGKEWEYSNNDAPSITISDDPINNIVVLEYKEKLTKIRISYQDTKGNKINETTEDKIQVGCTFDTNNYNNILDTEGLEWTFVYAKPEKLIAREENDRNEVTLVYDLKMAKVIINYKDIHGVEIKKPNIIEAVVDKKYNAKIEPMIIGEDKRAWVYISDAPTSIVVSETSENVINLTYDEMKVKVIISYEDLEENKIIDDEVIFVQMGKLYAPEVKETIFDNESKKWIFRSSDIKELNVRSNEKENIIKLVYEKDLAKVTLKMQDAQGKALKKDVIEEVQIGSRYGGVTISIIEDSNGKLWTCSDACKYITVSENEKENIIIENYVPLIAKVTIRYFDDERNQLLPDKVVEIQAGEKFIPDVIRKFEDATGKKWIYATKPQEFIVQKHDEENVISLYYDKELTKIKLLFKDAYGKELRKHEETDAQIGSEYNAKLFDKIVDFDGAKWQFEESNPKTMIVKETSNTFTLIYGEVRANILIKQVNLSGDVKIVDDLQIKARLGGLYVPNIREKIIDKNKRQWKFAGNSDISINTSENEQDNIIILNYEEDKAKVIVKYQDMTGKTIKEDITKDVQIGSEIKIEEKPQITDNDGLVWKFNNITNKIFRVSENEEQNITINKYEPFLIEITIKYIDEQKNELINSKIIKAQMGSKYSVEIIDRITDENSRAWIFSETKEKEIIIKEDNDVIELIYTPLKAIVTAMYRDEDENIIAKEDLISVQVGEIFVPQIRENIVDIEGKVWSYRGVNIKELKVSEDEQKNAIVYTFREAMTSARLIYKTLYGATLKEDETIKAQIGSVYIANPPKYLQDSNGFKWLVPEGNISKLKVTNEEKKNILEILYKEYLVNVYQRFENEFGEEIKEQYAEKRQVGDNYIANFDDIIEDKSGKLWVYSNKEKETSKIFATKSKAESIKVYEDEQKNVVILKYKPQYVDITVRFTDTFGNIIKKDEIAKAQIGSEYQAEAIESIVDEKGNKWTYNEKSNSKIKVSREGKENIVILSYEEQKALITYKYEDEDGNRLKAPTKVLAQIGSIFSPQVDEIIEDEQGRKWEYKSRMIKELLVKENEQDNIVILIYSKLTAEVILKIRDLTDNQIIDDIIIKAQIGSEYKPVIEERFSDNNSKLFKFVRCEPVSILVKEAILDREKNENIIKLVYEPVNTTILIKYLDIDGNVLKEDEVLHVQVGTKYTANAIQYIKDRKDNQWQIINDNNNTIRTAENPKDNVIKLIYEIAKTEVIVRYKDTEGNILKEDEHFPEQIGNEFIPETTQTIIDREGKKWSYFSAEPEKLKVGSINNIIDLTYQEAKTSVTIKYQNEEGKKLREEERILVQIGSRFKPKISAKVIYDENEIWRYSKSSPQEITVTDNKDENVIMLIYTDNAERVQKEDKAPVVQKEDKPKEPEQQPENISVDKGSEEVKPEIETEMDKDLLRLERSINLSPSEKDVIKQLNYYNDETIKIIRNNLERFKNKEQYEEANIVSLIESEKELIADGLKNIIQNDKTGNKLLKIFEHITASEMDDKLFASLQQRKTVLMADYFLNKPITDIEQANYICERGKNDKEIELIETKLMNEKETEEYAEIKCSLIYEKVLLDNYYKGRTLIKDNYFKDEMSKKSVPSDIIILVTNMLPKQAFNLILKGNSLEKYRINELQAILLLLTSAQKTALETMINQIKDGRQRKDIQKFYKKIS